MLPAWTLAVAFAAAVVAVLLGVWLVLGLYTRHRARQGADSTARERVTDPGVSAAWAHSRANPQASREPMVLDTDPDERGAALRPALRNDRDGEQR